MQLKNGNSDLKIQLDRIEQSLSELNKAKCYYSKTMYSEQETAEILGLTRSTLYSLKSRGRISYYKSSGSNISFFSRHHIEEFQKGKYYPADTETTQDLSSSPSFVLIFVDVNDIDKLEEILKSLLSNDLNTKCYFSHQTIDDLIRSITGQSHSNQEDLTDE